MRLLFGLLLLGLAGIIGIIIIIPVLVFKNNTLFNKLTSFIDWICDKYINDEEDSIS